MCNIHKSICKTSNSTFFSDISSHVRFHNYRVTSLCISILKCLKSAVRKELFLGIKYLLQNVYDTYNHSFDQICFLTWSQLSISVKRICHTGW